MYTIVKNGCPSGYAFVRDYLGNKMYYGTIKDCKFFIEQMEKEIYLYLKNNSGSEYGEMAK